MNWIIIKSISNTKILASTGIWIFLVPAFIKTSNLLNDSLSGQYFASVQLAPFSILLLYFSAFAFFLGSILYYIFCPRLIKLTDSFKDFESEGMNEHNLTKSLIHLDSHSAKSLISLLRKQANEATGEDIDKNNYFTITSSTDRSINLKKNQLSTAFWVTFEFLSEIKPIWRFLTASLFIIGFTLLTLIFIRNLEVVAIYTFDEFFSE